NNQGRKCGDAHETSGEVDRRFRRRSKEKVPFKSEGLSARYFSSTVQYAVSRNCFQLAYRWSARRMLMTGLRLGLTGLAIRCRCACSGVRPPFLTLHFTQQQTMFSQVLFPPWLLGTTWSSDSSVVGNFLPQYWQRLESRA